MPAFSKPNFQIKFPGDVDTHDQFMHFTIAKKYKFKREQIDEKQKYATITLPLPTALNTAYAATYSNQGLGIVGTDAARDAPENFAAMNAVADAIGSSNFMGKNGAVDNLKKIGNNLTGGNLKAKAIELAKYNTSELVTAVSAKAASGLGAEAALVTGILTNKVVKGTQVGLGVARNPYLAATFDGVNFKNHSFQFQLTPRNAEESDSIRLIISAFRNAMLPGKGTIAHYYDYPQQIDIVFRHDEYLFDIKTSVLTQFDVNYHSKGAYYHDINGKKAPVEVGISMTFLESTVRLSDDEKFRGGVQPPHNLGGDSSGADDTGSI